MSLNTKFTLKPFKPTTAPNDPSNIQSQTTGGLAHSKPWSFDPTPANSSNTNTNESSQHLLLPQGSGSSNGSASSRIWGKEFDREKTGQNGDHLTASPALPQTPENLGANSVGASNHVDVEMTAVIADDRPGTAIAKKTFAQGTLRGDKPAFGTKNGTHGFMSEKVTFGSSLNLLSGNTPNVTSGDGFRGKSKHSTDGTERSALVVHPQASTSNLGLVVGLPSGHNGTQDDPFHEVTKTIHAQNRRIKELEGQNREQGILIDQLRGKVSDGQEVARRSAESVLQLKEELARSKKTGNLKDDELRLAREQVGQLEDDRTRMITENLTLTKMLATEKKKFIAELKNSTDIILRLQGIREISQTAIPKLPSSLVMTPAMDETSATLRMSERDEIEKEKAMLIAKNGDLEQRFYETEGKLQQLNQWMAVMMDIIGQCTVCSEKFDMLQHNDQQPSEEAATNVGAAAVAAN